jgi:hypothetical protein
MILAGNNMTWIPLLLADPSPCLRWLVLRDLYHRLPDDPELQEISSQRDSDPLVKVILDLQSLDGSWTAGSLATGRAGANSIHVTALAMARLGYLGFDANFPAVHEAAEFLFSRQDSDGSWPLWDDYAQTDGSEDLPAKEHYSMIPLATAFPLRGLAACGYATDPRAERAYNWLLDQRLPDGAWPTGISSGVFGRVAGYRRLAHSRWGCRSNTTGALICLSMHPDRRTSDPAKRALDLLLGRETRESSNLGFEVARLVGAEISRGFFTFFARFDLALMLDLCARTDISTDDVRVKDLVNFVNSLRGKLGLWEYRNRPQVTRWLTFDILRSLDNLDEGEWVGEEPRTPFRPYPPKPALKRQ